MNSPITIKEVARKKEFNVFFDFPYTLFQHNKYWTPQMLREEKTTFNPKKNPAFEFCKAKMFLAYKENKVVGRVAAIINTQVNEIWGQKRIRFGWLDFIEDKEVAQLLLKAVEEWGKTEGMTEMVGPQGFCNMDRAGMIVYGFDVEMPGTCYYNPEYYPRILEELGFQKEVDTIQYELPAMQPVPEKILKINNLIKEKYKLKVLERISKKELAKRYGVKFFQTLNKSYTGLFGFVPLTEKQIHYYLKQYFPFLHLKMLCFIVDENDDIVGFGISFPSLSKALKKCKGKLFPFGWFYLLRALKNYEKIDLLLTGVTPEWQNKGVHSIYYTVMHENYIDLGVKTAIANPQLEDNEAHRIWMKYNSKLLIRRRIYKKMISD
ncbi:MAG: N-acetyltransferase [Bacteroidetes bacterium]|nr:N-acetyltransferase [Bacteroidota bacterium]MCL1968456.1 N-acetyltransferase [Bacteroidota bacterium]